MSFTGRFYYSYEVSAGGGGGRSYSSGSYKTGETAIKADIETYDEIVSNIETQNELVIQSETGYISPDAECLLNDIIPDYEQADHEVVEMLRLLKSEGAKVIESMKNIRDDIVNLDTAASQDGEALK